MTRKQYACIMQAKEVMKKIVEYSTGYSYYGSCGNCCDMANDISDIHMLSEKWLNDFDDVDCNWSDTEWQSMKSLWI